jgi:predicted nucleotidyltransferase component of viral defense system
MNIIGKCGTRFFLTGGTALSRAYYNHRYSDDLDFFVNDDAEYAEQVKLIFARLAEDGFSWDATKEFLSTKTYTTLKVTKGDSDVQLKLDFVNDVPSHFGGIIATPLYYRTDSIRNMLSNKLTALFRFAAKDVADIREIAIRENIDWKQAINDAKQKEGGIDLTIASDILRGMPRHEFETVAWVKKPSWDEFQADIERIVYAMISGEEMQRP